MATDSQSQSRPDSGVTNMHHWSKQADTKQLDSVFMTMASGTGAPFDESPRDDAY